MKYSRIITILALTSIGFFMISCSDQKPTAEKTTQESATVKSQAEIAQAEEQKNIYVQEAIKWQEQYSQKLTTLNRQVSLLSEQAKAEMLKETATIYRKNEEMTKKIWEITTASEKAFEKLKKDMENTMEDMEKSYDQALERINK